MKTIVIEHHLRIKEIWRVPDVYELGEDPSQIHGHRVSRRQLAVSPTIYRDKVEGESPLPADPHVLDRAERGYWSRLMAAWKGWLNGTL